MSMQLFENFIKKYLGSMLVHENFFNNPSKFTNRLFDHIAGIGDENAKDTKYVSEINISDIEFLFKTKLEAIDNSLKKINFHSIDTDEKLTKFFEDLDVVDSNFFNNTYNAFEDLAVKVSPYLLNGVQVKGYIQEAIGKDKFKSLVAAKGHEDVSTAFVISMVFRLFSDLRIRYVEREFTSLNNNDVNFSQAAFDAFITRFDKFFNQTCTFEVIQLAAPETQIIKKIDNYLDELRQVFFNKCKKIGGIFAIELDFNRVIIDEKIKNLNSLESKEEVSLLKIANQFKAAQELKEIIINNNTNIIERFNNFNNAFKTRKDIILNGDPSTKQASSKFVKTILDIISLGIYKLARIIKTRRERNLIRSTENVINDVSELSPQLKMGMKK